MGTGSFSRLVGDWTRNRRAAGLQQRMLFEKARFLLLAIAILFFVNNVPTAATEEEKSHSPRCFVWCDCSYRLTVEDGIILVGASPVTLSGKPLNCRGTRPGPDENSWILDYGVLQLSILNRVGDDACIFRWETTRRIHLAPSTATSSDNNQNNDTIVTSSFPSFAFEESRSASRLLDGRLSWKGSFVNPRYDKCTTGVRGGPCVLYDASRPSRGGLAVVFSPLDHFLNTQYHDNNNTAVWGASTASTIRTLPAGFSHSFVAVVGTDGVTDTVYKWGKFVQRYAGYRGRMKGDVTVETLGYQTDNGAQYCFCPKDCDEALLDEIDALRASSVPVRYLSFQNPWWKTSRSAPWCVTDWSWQPRKVPMGVPAFARKVALPLQFYAPYFCNDTTFARITNFTFVASNPSLPTCSDPNFYFLNVQHSQSLDFYRWFFKTQGMSMGMTHYELDFVDQNLHCMDSNQRELGVAEAWLGGMSEAALELGIPVQWCFATPSAVLQSLHYPAVTNVRVSWDYYYGNAWDIGRSSLLGWAVGGIAPSTDTFWTSDNGKVATTMGACDAKCPPDHGDTGCELHTMLAVMSTGPVGFSDAIHHTDVARILRTCRSDGVLLRPSKPITSMDITLGRRRQAQYDLLQTYSASASAGRVNAYYIVAHHVTQIPTPTIPLTDLWPRVHPAASWFVVWDHYKSDSTNGCRTDGAPAYTCGTYVWAYDSLQIPRPSRWDPFASVLASLAAVCPRSDVVLVGELDKYVSLSADRFRDVKCLDSGLLFHLKGAPGEKVTVSSIGEGIVHVHTHTIDPSGSNVVEYNYEKGTFVEEA